LDPWAHPRWLGVGVRDPRGLGAMLVYGPRTPGGWGLGLLASGPKRVRSLAEPKRVWGGAMSGPKSVRVWVLLCPDWSGLGRCLNPSGLGFGSDCVPTQGGWGLGTCPDPNGLGFGSVHVRTQEGWGRWLDPNELGRCPGPRGWGP